MDLSPAAMVDFLRERGGKVRNADFLEHFKSVFPEDPRRRAAVREAFKSYVDGVAYVKTEAGVKYVCLRKKYRDSSKETEPTVGVSGGEVACSYPASGDEDAAPPRAPPPGSDYGSESQVRLPHGFSQTREKSQPRGGVVVVGGGVVDSRSDQMGNRGSFKREKRESRREEKKREEEVTKPPEVPQIAVIEASPLPAESAVFNLPGPAQTGSTGLTATLQPEPPAGLPSEEDLQQSDLEDEDEVDHPDDLSSSGSDDNSSSPKPSRQHFIEVMMSSSPEVRRSMVLRNSVYLPRSDSDSLSLVSSTLEDDRASVALDPIEHEWMMCASDAEWASLHRLLANEPTLVLRKDFVTGFTCLHWAAKHNKPELIALIVNFSKQHHVDISVDVRTNAGYTPLHIAAMHNHMEVVKLLVGAYNADVDIRDYSGKKACQYLTDNVSVDLRDIIGAYEASENQGEHSKRDGRWRFSKGLQFYPKPLRGQEERVREPPLRRKSSLSRMKPALQRLRKRTSQLVHSHTFHGRDDLDGSGRSSRPKTHFLW